MKQKLKECVDCGRTTLIWSKGRCKACSNASQLSVKVVSPPGRDNIPLKAKKPMKKKSDKRVEQEKKYKEICDRMDTNHKWVCFFCGGEIKAKKPDHHHLDGREEHYLTPGLIVFSHRKCHSMYHDTSFKKLPWRYAYLQRLRLKDEQLYQRELFKLDK